MRHSLKTLALAAGIAVTASAGIAATPTTALAAPLGIDMASQKAHGPADVQLARHVLPGERILVARRCLVPQRVLFARERKRILGWGYVKVRYAGGFQSKRRCYQVLRLTACRGYRKIVINVRYRYGKRISTSQRYRGFCYIPQGPNRFKSAS